MLKQQQLQPQTNNMVTNELTSNDFNYTLFWEHAANTAERSLQRAPILEQRQAQGPCPKVYVYDEHLRDINKYNITTSPVDLV